jgi:hypothetical protein
MLSQPASAATGIDPRRIARPKSAATSTGRRRRRSTQAPASSPNVSPATISADRKPVTSSGPAPRTRIATYGRASRVMSEPKIETVAAVHMRTNAALPQIDESVSDDIASHGIRQGTGNHPPITFTVHDLGHDVLIVWARMPGSSA